jgi:hypothetical protein
MNEEFDDNLKNRISEVFEGYGDDSANEGWLLLRERYPERKRRGLVWLWWASAAAVLLVFLGLVLWMNKETSKVIIARKSTPVSIEKRGHEQTGGPQHPDTAKAQTPAYLADGKSRVSHAEQATSADKTSTAVLSERSAKSGDVNKNRLANISGSKPIAANRKHLIHTSRQKQNGSADKLIESIVQNQQTKAGNNETEIEIIPRKPVESPKFVTNISVISDVKNDTGTKSSVKPIVKPEKKYLFANQTTTPAEVKKQTADKRVKFGVYAATYFNYAKGSDNEFNIGAGLATEIRITGNLKLLTGIAISQNSLNYRSAIPVTANYYLATSISSNTNSIAYSPPVNGSVLTNTLRNYQASLVGLDIPLNLKYQLGKGDTYISAGVSSGTYINETYQYTYDVVNSSSANASLAPSAPQNSKTQNTFGSFDLARTLNFSFGTGVSLGKKNRLIVEPFLKYPLDGLGSQQLKFGAGGVNLKFNFLPAKK